MWKPHSATHATVLAWVGVGSNLAIPGGSDEDDGYGLGSVEASSERTLLAEPSQYESPQASVPEAPSLTICLYCSSRAESAVDAMPPWRESC